MHETQSVELLADRYVVLVREGHPAIVMPHEIARGFAVGGGYRIIEPALPLRDFVVSLHWSRRFEADGGNAWLRGVITGLFRE